MKPTNFTFGVLHSFSFIRPFIYKSMSPKNAQNLSTFLKAYSRLRKLIFWILHKIMEIANVHQGDICFLIIFSG